MRSKKFISSVGLLCLLVILLSAFALEAGRNHEPGDCGWQHDGELCEEGFCCSTHGFCGTGPNYCEYPNCQSQCHDSPPPPCTKNVSDIVTIDSFYSMIKLSFLFPAVCNGYFYTYKAFIDAAKTFCDFGTTGTDETRRRELAAFFGQTSYATTEGEIPLLMVGFCHVRSKVKDDYCVPSKEWPCVPGQQYYGRGPIQLRYNYNYGQAGEALGLDLLSNPDLVATDPVVSFKTAIWFWMTAQSPKPSCHDVMVGKWTPSPADVAANRLPGYGLVTNIINGDIECGHGPDVDNDPIDYYRYFCNEFDATMGDNLDCYNQTHYGVTLKKPYPQSLLKSDY